MVSFPKILSAGDFARSGRISSSSGAMLAILRLLGMFVADLFRSRRRLEVENLFLRHQLNIALRRAPDRLRLRGSDRALLVWMTWLWPSLLGLPRVIQPDTILRWHRAARLAATSDQSYSVLGWMAGHGGGSASPGRAEVVGDIGCRRGWLFAAHAR